MTFIIVVIVIISIFAIRAMTDLALFPSNSISRPLIIVMNRMKLIASGDLSSEPLKTNSKDEIGQLVQQQTK